jgi:hypothetical protein
MKDENRRTPLLLATHFNATDYALYLAKVPSGIVVDNLLCG